MLSSINPDVTRMIIPYQNHAFNILSLQFHTRGQRENKGTLLLTCALILCGCDISIIMPIGDLTLFHAKAHGVYVNSDYDSNCGWWLRSSGDYHYTAANVNLDGTICSNYVYISLLAARPTFRINLEGRSRDGDPFHVS